MKLKMIKGAGRGNREERGKMEGEGEKGWIRSVKGGKGSLQVFPAHPFFLFFFSFLFFFLISPSYLFVALLLSARPLAGLDTEEVKRRTLVYGPNEFATHETEPLWKKYLEQVRKGKKFWDEKRALLLALSKASFTFYILLIFLSPF